MCLFYKLCDVGGYWLIVGLVLVLLRSVVKLVFSYFLCRPPNVLQMGGFFFTRWLCFVDSLSIIHIDNILYNTNLLFHCYELNTLQVLEASLFGEVFFICKINMTCNYCFLQKTKYCIIINIELFKLPDIKRVCDHSLQYLKVNLNLNMSSYSFVCTSNRWIRNYVTIMIIIIM